MFIDGIGTQRISLSSMRESLSRPSMESLMSMISETARKAVTPAGPTATERNTSGETYVFYALLLEHRGEDGVSGDS